MPHVERKILRWTDDWQPGWVEARLVDADGFDEPIAQQRYEVAAFCLDQILGYR